VTGPNGVFTKNTTFYSEPPLRRLSSKLVHLETRSATA